MVMRLSMKKIENEFVENFPGDETGNLSARQTPGLLFSKTIPTPVENPKLLAWNKSLAAELQIQKPNAEDIDILAGNKITDSMKAYASCYGGHQFGQWAGQLGDGRAITLGEWKTDHKKWEIQLKGAGPTPYSRGADGRAVLRSSLREYFVSEAMHHLGIPTTRALSLISTGEEILRDMFYNGNPKYEPGAIVTRVAPSFLRFGNFEILAARNDINNLEKLVNWTINKYFPHLQGEDKIIRWFEEIVQKTAILMVEWQRVGFVHGVMNTDNMSILGLSIDYGPFSFLDNYDPNFTPNTTDLPGRRYAFGNQASVAYWNLGRMASAILPLLEDSEKLETALKSYENIFWSQYFNMMGRKLGLDKVEESEKKLIADLEDMLAEIQPDMTLFYRLLIDFCSEFSEEEILKHFEKSFYNELTYIQKGQFLKFFQNYSEKLKNNQISRSKSREIMSKANPKFILRNYLLHQTIEELEKGENTLFLKLQDALKDPYSDSATKFFSKRPDWASKKAGCSMLSCSS